MDCSVSFAPTASDRVDGSAARGLTPRRTGLVALAAVIALLPLGVGTPYYLDLAILCALNAIVCIGLNLLIGYAGQISLGHAAFFALGGYGSALLTARYGWPPLAAWLAAGAAVACIAWLVGRPILRLRGHYLAMATLGFGVIVSIVLATEDRITGGPDGMAVPPLALFGFALQGERVWYWVAGVALLVATWLALNLIESPAGRALRALHASEIAAEICGVDTARQKVRVFVLSAVFAALAGGLMAHYSGFITPVKSSFLHSVELVTMVVFGGMASVFGAIVGATVLTLLPQMLTALKEYEMVVFGALLILTMVFLPRGIVPTLKRWLERRER